ncbi:MAG: amino acid permease [Lachnospiraceae bacterium]|nr:amino acid permease [Lachnospiraceae bacterium]
MKKQKNKLAISAIMSVAFIWFTTHFGGGFASGAQLYSYFGKYGGFCLILPVLAMAYDALFFGYALHFAKKHEVYDYRSYNNAFYGKFAPVFSNLFEVIYLVTMCLAPAVAFATGGATLKEVTGLPYPVCTVIIGLFIFVVAIFGSRLVRKVASVLSIVIIAGLLIVYIPNIIVGADRISASVAGMSAGNISFGSALYSAFLYGTFQLINIAVFVQHAETFGEPKEAKKSMGVGFVINALMMVVVALGLLTISNDPDIANQSVPTLFMVQKGVGASFMVPLVSILIILGAVSTAVNMVAAMVKRVSVRITTEEERKSEEESGKPGKKTVIIALVCCLIDFGIAQFGLLTLVQKAYSFLAYLEIPVILIPYIIHMIVTRFDTKEKK